MSPPLAEERLTRIVQLLAERGTLRTAALTELLGVSSATIRRDLDVLAGRGLIRKLHGGAALAAPEPEAPLNQDQFYRDRQQVNHLGKQRLAGRALELIAPGQTLYLDAGTTALALAEALQRTPQLTRTLRVVTHGIDVAYVLNGECALYVVGGEVYGSTYSLTGPDALSTVSRYNYDLFFVSCTSIDPAGRLTNSNSVEAQQKASILRQSRRSVLIADQSKWGPPGFAPFAGFAEVSAWVTDRAPATARAAFEQAGVTVLEADASARELSAD
ncbi:DeoR/GlpR family DNA-binding transcription regulator [Deinococcus radiodurans]|jgi:transcriptional regulator, DeoR family|uniref:Glycerol-3-phosphate regulon repressor n=1 Tax=Deinococcus radiodurans (strain ATCC 13939 / DSM 20539 / JCM 16871 / CCUG 27074 / LMG 4051 / NBRC 15346 / NCIMB 9279 / VKM B-1422 / R1) TaxID=243230 RepID=Q9RZP5_DEIRA|nr:DeoR/GlpR family DNA-binding transcription regulator [Deinococcus radiodurans]AAF12597.1 glycerol-3-phosphate regulon repressor [Deinococcus radiodurans R1 = ATCC 13939 = DSM 20539]ANC73279.1 glycerol-3-phosphate regulon repressor [Deinococcus radiodurans R1 = ATCC 13939 = DSM 20539]QEM73270.1 DeoR/GlpR transcriptional regulator [Deinococcus radiodurans]QIP30661.1 DeoR/GlpR transcriptional regulator [Deinococcus radiodurans]QIP33539.1 DeoR/GlpR transcriptional regulator [Deinococcus radiodu